MPASHRDEGPTTPNIPRRAGISRARLVSQIRDLPPGTTALVCAPAGSGKTTLLAHAAAEIGERAAWIAAGAIDGSEKALVRRAAACMDRIAEGVGGRVVDLHDLIEVAGSAFDAPITIFIDDAHLLHDTEAGRALRTLAEQIPHQLRLVVASRRRDLLPVERLALEGQLAEITSDDLRFRTWEVEELFRDLYQAPMLPVDTANLTRRTAGWAAGIALFHLATRNRSASDRRRVLEESPTRTRQAKDYLATTILDTLTADDREFLLETSLFERVTASRADTLLGTTGSEARLERFARVGLFVFRDDDGTTYRYHDVLRSFLIDSLAANRGSDAIEDLGRRAARLLEREGAVDEAVLALTRASLWDEVAQLLGAAGEQIAASPGAWIERLPAHLREHDPWVNLAIARQLVADGDLTAAVVRYTTACALFTSSGGVSAAVESEVRRVERWLDPDRAASGDWFATLRQRLALSPVKRWPAISTPADCLLAAIVALADGDPLRAQAVLDELDHHRPDRATEQIAAVIRCVATIVEGRAPPAPWQDLGCASQFPAVDRVARVMRASFTAGDAPVARIVQEADDASDAWGGAALRLVAALAVVVRRPVDITPDARSLAREAAERFSALGADLLTQWAEALVDVFDRVAGTPLASPRAAVTARPAMIDAIVLLTRAAPDHSDRAIEQARQLAPDHAGLVLAVSELVLGAPEHRAPQPFDDRPQPATTPSPRTPASIGGAPGVAVRCLGSFEMAVDGTQVAMHDIRPLPLTILKILAINANRRVSTDVLCEALWPDGDPSATSHRIQVAISDLRRSLPIGRDRARTLIRREGDGYRLDVEPDDHDLLALQARWARLRNNGIEPIELSAQLQSLVDDHRLDVLVDDPYAEWATDARDTVRGIVATATERLVDLLSATDPAAAVAYARIGLGFDPYRDRLWQAMIDALEASGQPLAAQSVRAEYAAALAEIGVTSTAH